MANNILDNIKSISNIFEYFDFDLTNEFWDYLNENEITWGSKETITLIKKNYIKDLIIQFILNDPDDEDNPTFINMINQFFNEYKEDFIIID